MTFVINTIHDNIFICIKNIMEHNKIKPFLWGKEYLVNNTLLDEQHKKFVRLINKLAEAINKGCKNEIHNVFFEIIYYIEHYMIEKDMSLIHCDKKKYLKHRNSHNKLLFRVKECYGKFNATTALDCCTNLHSFLRSWFVDYIRMIKRDNYNDCWNP